jgi:beta-mannosidase
MTRKEKKTFANDVSAAQFAIATILEVWGTNSTLSEKTVKLEVTCFDLHSSWTAQFTKDAVLAPNSSTELYSGDLPGQPVRTKHSELPRVIIVSARLLDASGAVLGRYSNW